MKRKILMMLVAVLTVSLVAFSWGCKKEENKPSIDNNHNDSEQTEVQKQDITGVTFEGLTTNYDGKEYEIKVSGQIPDGVKVTYTDNKATDAGTYNAKAVLSGEKYNTKTLNAVLKINKIDITGVTFEDQSFSYDGTEKTIEVIGALPSGTSVTYTCKENGNIKNTAVATGSYTITATLTNRNFNTLVLTATMTIKGSEKERYITVNGNNVYFGNALDEDYLYSYNMATEALNRVSFDVPYYFINGNSSTYFYSKSLFGGSIKSIDVNGEVTVNANVKGEYLCYDGTSFYYVVNALTNDKSGIYKLTPNGSEEPHINIVSQGKAKYLQYLDGKLYFADGLNGWKLSCVTANGVNSSRTMLSEDKVVALTASGNYLYYTSDGVLGNCIKNYNVKTNKSVKLTMDAGSNLTVIGDKLYYINVDLFTSLVEGDGIYYVDANPSKDSNKTGTKLFGNDSFSSLTKAGNSKIAYYRVSDQMLCVTDLNNMSTIEVLKNFTPPETIPLSTGSKTQLYDGKIFYLDLHRDKCLYSYDPSTSQRVKMTSNKVSDFAIIGDVLYYNTITLLVNNDLYKVNLKTGGAPLRVSENDCKDVVLCGDKIFYVEQNAAGVRTAIHEINKGIDKIIYSKGVDNLTCYKNNLYFVDGKELLTMPVENYTVDEPKKVCDKHVKYFTIKDGVIYFRELFGFAYKNKQLSKINIDGTGYEVLAENCDPTNMIVAEDYIYYYSDTMDATLAGFYKYNIKTKSVEKMSERNVDGVDYYGTEMTLYGNNIYFINYCLGGVGGDSHLYSFNVNDYTMTKIK